MSDGQTREYNKNILHNVVKETVESMNKAFENICYIKEDDEASFTREQDIVLLNIRESLIKCAKDLEELRSKYF